MTAPDRDLLAATESAMSALHWPDNEPILQLNAALRQQVTEAALAAAGRVLAERLRADADRRDDDVRRAPGAGVFSDISPGMRGAATAVARWCGAEPEAPSGVLDYSCVECGGPMEPYDGGRQAICPRCGHVCLVVRWVTLLNPRETAMALRRVERCPLTGDHAPHAHPSWDGPWCPGVDVPPESKPAPYVEPESCVDVVIPGVHTAPGCGHRMAEHRGFGGCTVDGCECPRGRAPVTPPRRRTKWPGEYDPAPPIAEAPVATGEAPLFSEETIAEAAALMRAAAVQPGVTIVTFADAARAALGSPGVRREVQGLRVQLADANGYADECEAAIIRNRNRALAERDRLAAALADAVTGRDRLRVVAAKMAALFDVRGHPGRECLRTSWVPVALVAEWRAALAGDAEQVCAACDQPMSSPPCARNPITGQGGHTVAGGATEGTGE